MLLETFWTDRKPATVKLPKFFDFELQEFLESRSRYYFLQKYNHFFNMFSHSKVII